MKKALLAAAAVLALTGCASTYPGTDSVKLTPSPSQVEGCTSAGSLVAFNDLPGANQAFGMFSHESIGPEKSMQERAAKLGADTVLVSVPDPEKGGCLMCRATGVAYRCPRR